jgi:hypothetical protein
VNGEELKISAKEELAYFSVLFQHSPGEFQEHHK